ncbi:MAG: penicillin-binding protein 2, partial [Alphaproteobacteria bacterium]|nr:penicillin-binding protein 2 [Alphaproteobacteria bacterium]
MAKIQVNNLDFTGVYVEEGKRRFYPFDEIAAHVIGYVSDVTEQELKSDPSPILQLPDFKTGKAGIEKLMDKELRGEVGESIQVVNATGRVIETLDDKKKRRFLELE